MDSSSGANSDARIANPLALNLYVLGFDSSKRLGTVNRAVKENIQTYLTQFRMVTDAVNIKNGFVINIGVKFNVSIDHRINAAISIVGHKPSTTQDLHAKRPLEIDPIIGSIIEIGNNGTQTTLTIEKMKTNVSLPINFFRFEKKDYPNFYIIE